MLVAKMGERPEIFYTFQGEGVNIGKPAVFVRLATCNLHCTFCDTPYTWNWKGTPFKHRKGKKYDLKMQSIQMTSKKVVDYILKVAGNCNRIIFTGGEPMLQQNEILEVMKLLHKKSFVFEIETNGTVSPKKEFFNQYTFFNCSPKLQNSGNEKKLRFKKEALERISRNGIFKFVIENPKDLREVKQIQKEVEIPSKNIYLMPEGITKKIVTEREKWIAEICKKEGYNLTTRLHVLVYGGAKRGV